MTNSASGKGLPGLLGTEHIGLTVPDMDAAKAWYQSPAYQEAKVHRLAGATYRVLVTEGVG